MIKSITKWLKIYTSEPEAIALITILGVTILSFWLFSSIVTPIALSIIIAYILNGAVHLLITRFKLHRLAAVVLVYFFFLGLFTAAVLLLFPVLVQQLSNLLIELPRTLNSTQRFITNLSLKHPGILSASQINSIISELTNFISGFGRFIFDFSLASISNIITIILYIILVPVLAFFFLKDGKQMLDWFGSLLPRQHNRISRISHMLDEKMWAYIRGRVLEIIFVGAVSSLILNILGMNYATLLGVFIGISVIIPYVGAILVTIPVLVVGFLQWGGDFHFIALLISFTSIMILDAYLLVPILFAEKMRLHPIVILLSILIFGSLLGFWGVFFAIPLATLLDTLIKYWPKATKE